MQRSRKLDKLYYIYLDCSTSALTDSRVTKFQIKVENNLKSLF